MNGNMWNLSWNSYTGSAKERMLHFYFIVRNMIYVSLKNFSLRDVTWKKVIKNLTYI